MIKHLVIYILINVLFLPCLVASLQESKKDKKTINKNSQQIDDNPQIDVKNSKKYGSFDGEGVYQKLIDETECPRVSKFLDLIQENQASLVTVTALEHVENSNILIVGTQSGDIELWDFQSKDILTRFSSNNSGASIKQIIYLTSFDRILVLYENPFTLLSDDTQAFSLIIWDPQTQRQVFSFPKMEHFHANIQKQLQNIKNILGNKIIDISVEQVKYAQGSSKTTQNSTDLKFVIITDISLITCTLNSNMNASCKVDQYNKSYIQHNPLKIFITSSDKYTIFTQSGLIEYNAEKHSYSALLLMREGTFSQCQYYPNKMKYILLKDKEDAIHIFDQDSQKDQMKKLTELRIVKQYLGLQKQKYNKSINIVDIVKIENKQPVIFVLFKDGALLHINYEDDKILEEFKISNAKIIAPLKQSPSFFIAQQNGSISFYRQTMYLGTIDLQHQNPFQKTNQLRRLISQAPYQSQSTKEVTNEQQNYVAEIIQNIFRIYYLTFQSVVTAQNQPISFFPDQEIADYLVNFSSNIVYFYEAKNEILFICKVSDLSSCVQKQIPMNTLNKDESYQYKMKRVIHFNKKAGLLIVNNLNNIYVFSVKEGDDISLQDHLTLVFSQKYITRSQSPMMINLMKQRYDNSYDSTLIFVSDGNKLTVFEYLKQQKSLNEIYIFRINKPNDKIVAIEVIEEEQLIMLQFINNTFQFYNLKQGQLLKSIIELEQYNNQFINYDFFLELDLRRVKGTNHIISQLNNKRVVIFDYKTKVIHFMSDSLNNYVNQFKIDYHQQIFYIGQYSSTENISYYDLILQRPYLEFRSDRGSIDKAQLFSLQGSQLILQHTDFSFWIVDLEQKRYKPTWFFEYTKILPNDKIAFFIREGLFTLITTSGKVYKYPFQNSQIIGPPNILESPCPNCNFDDKIRIKNTTISNIFLIHDSSQLVLYNSQHNEIIWYKKFDVQIIDVLSLMDPCELHVGFKNNEIQLWNCQDKDSVFLEKIVISQEDIISFHKSVEDNNQIYVVSKNKVIFYQMQPVQNDYSIIDSIYNLINPSQNNNSPPPPPSNTVYELSDSEILKSKYLKQIGIQILLTTKNQLLLLGFGQRQIMRLQSLTNDPSSIIFIGCTEDRKRIIILTTQKVWFINIWPLFQYLNYDVPLRDFYKEIPPQKSFRSSLNQFSPNQFLQTQGKFNNACLLNIYFQASSETRSMSVFGQGAKTDPYSHFSAVQSLLIQVGLSNLIFNYRENQLNLRFFSHEPNLYHKISKRVSLQNSAFTQINFIGEQNQENRDENTILEIEGGYELNQYMSVSFNNIIFKSIDTQNEEFDPKTSVTTPQQDKGILQFSVLNIENLIFENVNFGLYSTTQEIPKYISVTNCTKLCVSKSEFYGTSFLIDNLSQFKAESTLIYGVKSDMISNEKQKVNLLKKKGMIFIRQIFSNKSLDKNRMILQQLNLQNCQVNSVKLFAFACYQDAQVNVKAPSILMNSTFLQHSSIIGLASCRFLQDLIVNIDTVQLIDLGYKDSQILTDGFVPISRIQSIVIKNTAYFQIKNYGSQASLLVQHPSMDTSIGKLELKNLYLSDTVLFQITKNFNVVETNITNCKLGYSEIFNIQTSRSQINILISKIKVIDSEFLYQSKIFDIQNTQALRIEVELFTFTNVNSTQSSLIQAQQDKSQITLKIIDIIISSCYFQNSRLIDKGSQVYTDITKLVVNNGTHFENSILYKSAINLENQSVNLLNIPMFNLIENLEITKSRFNQSKILEIKEQANLFIKNLNFTDNLFTAKIQDAFTEFQQSFVEFNDKNNDEKITLDDNFFNVHPIKKIQSSSSISQENRIRYLLEVTNIKIFNSHIVFNDFQGYILSGQPQTQSTQSEISQIYQNLNFSHNTFLPQSNFIFLEINFNSLNRNSSVQVTNFTLVNNTVDILNPNIPLSQLEDGRAFYFFGSDKLGKVDFKNGVIQQNENIGFLNIKFSLNSISINNVNATGKNGSFIQYQPFLQVLHPRRFLMTSCNFEDINIVGSTFLNIELNRQYFLVENIPSEGENDSIGEKMQIKNIKNINSQRFSSQKNTLFTQEQDQKNDLQSEETQQKMNKFKNFKYNFNNENNKNYSSGSGRQDERDSHRNLLLQEILEGNNENLIEERSEKFFSSYFDNTENYTKEEEIFMPDDDESGDDNQVDLNPNNNGKGEQREEMYYVILFNNKFKHIRGYNISSSITSFIFNIQTGLVINVFVEKCIFQDNQVTAGESYSRQRRLSQIEVMAINANIFINNNEFLYGRFELPFSFTVDTVYLHLLGRQIQFRNKIQSYNYFKGQCSEQQFSNYLSAAIIEGKQINIESSIFNGTCTQTQPTIYIKLFDQSQLRIVDTQFIDLYASQQGAGLVVNGVQNKVQITINSVSINRMHSPSTQSEGFFLFNNLKTGSQINIFGITANNLYTQNGSLLRSSNSKILISLEKITIDNSFNRKLLDEYIILKNKLLELESSKVVQDFINQKQNNDSNPHFGGGGNAFNDLDNDDNFDRLLGAQQNQIIQKDNENRLTIEEDKDKVTKRNLSFKKKIYFDEKNAYQSLQKEVGNISDELKHIDGGQLIQINNADQLKIINLTVQNYGIVFNQFNELIFIENVGNVYIKGLNLFNNTFYKTSALIVQSSQIVFRDSEFINNSYKGPSLVVFQLLQTTKNSMENVKLNENQCNNNDNCFAVMLASISMLHMRDVEISKNSGNNTVGALYYSLPSLSILLNYLWKENTTLYQDKPFTPTSEIAKVILDNITIKKNQASSIGGIALEIGQDLQCLILNSDISQNYGPLIGGISLQIHDPNSILFVNTTITENVSEYIGGIQIQKSSTLQLRDHYKKFIFDNKPNQIASGPRSFQIIPVNNSLTQNASQNQSLNNQQKQYDQQSEKNETRYYEYIKKHEKLYEIFEFNSGDNLPSFYLKLFDENNNTFISDRNPNVKVYLSQESLSQKGSFLKGFEGQYYSGNSQKYDPNIGLLFESLQLYGQPGSTVTIIVKLSDIKYENANSLVTFSNSSIFYSFKINIHMRKCVKGEVIKNNLMTTECEQCSKQYYSLLDPHQSQNTKCLKCPDNVQCPGSNSLVLNEGFWRDDSDSDTIIECQFSNDNCLGGIKVGDDSCTNNRIGPLCETCDIKQGFTDLSANQCLNCSQIWQASLIIIFILVFFIFYIFISIDSTVSRIKKLGILFEYSSANHIGQTSMLVKQFVSYLQVLSIISYFRFNFGRESISSIIYTIGNPLIAFNNIASCFIYQFSSTLNIPHIYISFTMSILIPITLSLIVLIVQMIMNFRNYYYRKYYLSTMMLVNYFYFTPLILARTMELMTCRQIGNKQYISASIMYSCGLDVFQQMNLFYLLPLIFILLFAIPIWIIYRIRVRFVQKLPLKYFQYILGDFRKKYFYWEFVRFFTKIALVSLPILFQQDIRTMGQVLNLILIFYYASVLYFHPYWTEICQRMELITGAALFITFHFCLLSYNKDNYSVWWWVTIVVIALTNIPLIAWYTISFFQAYKPILNRFFNQGPRRKMSESDDPQARARLLWQLALFTVQKHIKKEKMQQALAHQRNAKSQKSDQHGSTDNSSFTTRYTLQEQRSENKKKSRLLWWRKSGRSSIAGLSSGEQNNIQKNINQPLLQKGNNTVMHNHQYSGNSDDYNPYHDFNFSFLPQENTSKQRKNKN